MLVKSKSSDDPKVTSMRPIAPASLTRRLFAERIARFRRERRSRDGTPDGIWHDCFAPYRPIDFSAIRDADVVHLHWTSGLLDWPTALPWLAKEKPLVWTLHDMNPFLGSLHFRDFTTPLPKAFAKWEESVCRRKGLLVRNIPTGRLRIVAPSRWMKLEAERSEWISSFTIDHIPYGVDTTVFHPLGNRDDVRRSLQIPTEKVVLGFVAQNISDKRKGFAVLIDALSKTNVKKDQIVLLIAGGNAPRIEGIASIHLGSFDNERLMNVFYNALDVFVCPSLADNLPNTVLEAMSCGVPTVAFDAGGLADMVRPGLTGWLASPVGDAAALASSLTTAIEVISNPTDYAAKCCDVASSEFGLQRQAKALEAVYREMTTMSTA